ncbi:hypothetical protein G4B84_005922 [Aspergillus flavus NRRL3357]|nr:uncharacterized protein G4B84_005922 [Aspergillus flavus NRRL3357]QMW30541.1 hypothetical protein G4B84_005922 [Aspergillus flavus NRRL3357]QMW42599.1 hypothetical protein G4B11_005969 [Aspergillus flavus]
MLSATRLQVGRMGNRSRLLYGVLMRNPLHNGRGLEPILELPFFLLPASVPFDEEERDDRDDQQENDGNEDRFEQDLQDTHNDGGNTIEGEQLMPWWTVENFHALDGMAAREGVLIGRLLWQVNVSIIDGA